MERTPLEPVDTFEIAEFFVQEQLAYDQAVEKIRQLIKDESNPLTIEALKGVKFYALSLQEDQKQTAARVVGHLLQDFIAAAKFMDLTS